MSTITNITQRDDQQDSCRVAELSRGNKPTGRRRRRPEVASDKAEERLREVEISYCDATRHSEQQRQTASHQPQGSTDAVARPAPNWILALIPRPRQSQSLHCPAPSPNRQPSFRHSPAIVRQESDTWVVSRARDVPEPVEECVGALALADQARRHIAAATRSAAARSSSSGTFGRTSSQSGSAIPDASSIPSGRGRNQTWKCAPPSPQR